MKAVIRQAGEEMSSWVLTAAGSIEEGRKERTANGKDETREKIRGDVPERRVMTRCNNGGVTETGRDDDRVTDFDLMAQSRFSSFFDFLRQTSNDLWSR